MLFWSSGWTARFVPVAITPAFLEVAKRLTPRSALLSLYFGGTPGAQKT